MVNKIKMADFPTTRYQGSKRKILPWIYENLKDLQFNSVLDGCGGSASVSYLFKKMGKVVTYNDNLKFNHIIGKALIQNQKVLFTEEDVNNLFTNELQGQNVIDKLFKDIYYLDAENAWLDKIGYGILNMNHYIGETLDLKKSIAYYALFQACLTKRPFNLFHRNNLNLRTADVKRNFGNKTTWDKDFSLVFRSFIEEANSRIFDSGTVCRSTNESVFEIADVTYDLVYLDLPYVNSEKTTETSNYLRSYHFLEGIANYEAWVNMIDYDSTNLRLREPSADRSFTKKNICKSFETLIEKFQQSKIVLSYKKGGIPSIEFLVETMQKYKSEVYTCSRHYSYALNKQSGNNPKVEEVLIIGF